MKKIILSLIILLVFVFSVSAFDFQNLFEIISKFDMGERLTGKATSGSYCTGASVNCADIKTQTDCINQQGCTWDLEGEATCTGKAQPCNWWKRYQCCMLYVMEGKHLLVIVESQNLSVSKTGFAVGILM